MFGKIWGLQKKARQTSTLVILNKQVNGPLVNIIIFLFIKLEKRRYTWIMRLHSGLSCPSKWSPWEAVLLDQWYSHCLHVCLSLGLPSETTYELWEESVVFQRQFQERNFKEVQWQHHWQHREPPLRKNVFLVLVVLLWEQLANFEPKFSTGQPYAGKVRT